MTLAPVQPLFFKDMELLIGQPDAAEVSATDPDFRQHLDTCSLDPSSSQQSWTGLGLNTHTDASAATWTMAAAGAQDWDSQDSFSWFLYDNEGSTCPYLLRPRAGKGPAFKGRLVVTPGAIGGKVNGVAPFSVTLGLTGKPERVPADQVPTPAGFEG